MSDSPCPRLLENNDAPLETEIPRIRAFISEQQSLLGVLDSQVTGSSADSELLTQRHAIADHIQAHIAVLSPLRRVPAELWSSIFLLVTCKRRVGNTPRNIFPWRLGHICSVWRDVALSNPFLWHRFELLPTPGHSFTDLFSLCMIETQLARSASVHINVALEWWNGGAAESALLERANSRNQLDHTYLPDLNRFAAVSLL